MTAVFDKTLTARGDLLAGSQATTLMSADIERIGVGLQILHELWANVALIAVALWLLYQQIGFSSLSVLALIVGRCFRLVKISVRNHCQKQRLTVNSLRMRSRLYCWRCCGSPEALAPGNGEKTA